MLWPLVCCHRGMTLRMTLIGGPTALVEIGGLRILIDPTFDAPQTYTGAGTEGTKGITKTTGPAFTVAEVAPVDVALVSHDHHIDNLDESGRMLLKDVKHVFTTTEGAQRLGNGAVGLADFESTAVPLPGGGELTVTGVPAHHGPDGVWQLIGPVTGFVLSADDLPTICVSGDNSSLDIVRDIAQSIGSIDLAILFAGGACFDEVADGAPLTLTNDAALEAARILNAAKVIPVHADSWGHFRQGQDQMRDTFEAAGMADRIVVLHPGESVELNL
jgi:L-ascorbate metabolism protein UlaG (beta-lactamase superfamily)